MTKQGKILIILILVIGVSLMFWVSSGKSTSRNNDKGLSNIKTVSYNNWQKRFNNFEKNPLDLFLFNRLLQTHNDTNKLFEITNWFMLDSILNDSLAHPSFVFVGDKFGITDAEITDLETIISRGSKVIISYNELTDNITSLLTGSIGYGYEYGEQESVVVKKDTFNFTNLFQNDTVATTWSTFEEIYTDYDVEILSTINGYANAISIKIDQGELILHGNPSLFQNYNLKTVDGFKYSESVINRLPTNQEIYLLEIARLSDNYGDYDDLEGDNEADDHSYLQFIFDNPMLLNALILTIIGLVLFLLFRSKRLQPIVPYIAPKKDMTLVFSETITSIYLSRNNPYGLLQIQKRNFYTAVSKHFFVDLNKVDNSKAIKTLSEKSNKSIDEIQSIVNRLETKTAFSTDDKYILETSKIIRKFYVETNILNEEDLERIGSKTIVIERSLILPAVAILSGIMFFLFGMYYLTNAQGFGILLWPVGIILIIVGIMQTKNPLMSISQDDLSFYSVFGKKITHKKSDITSIETTRNGVNITFSEKKHRINYFEVSYFKIKQLKHFISQLNALDL